MTDWDTRRESREPKTAAVRVRINAGMQTSVHLAKEGLEVELIDISVHGLGVLSPAYLPPGTLLDLDLPASILSEGEGKPPQNSIQATGQVTYAKPKDRKCRLGICFTELKSADRTLIEKYIASQERRRSPRTPIP